MIILTDQNFETEVLKADLPVLVDFYAEWCGPCQMLKPIIEELATEYEDKVKVGKINVDEGQNTASKYGVMSIPTVILFDKGQEIKRQVGLTGKDQLMEMVENV